MNTKFNSQICTTREQSERLLSLGLKTETADMALIENWEYDLKDGKFFTGEYFERPIDYVEGMTGHYIPAWSLHRLIEMMPTMIKRWNQDWELSINGAGVIYFRKDTTAIIEALANNVYGNMISIIEWLIMEGYFPKEYLDGLDSKR